MGQILRDVARSIVPTAAHVSAGAAANEWDAGVSGPHVGVVGARGLEVAKHAGKGRSEKVAIADCKLVRERIANLQAIASWTGQLGKVDDIKGIAAAPGSESDAAQRSAPDRRVVGAHDIVAIEASGPFDHSVFGAHAVEAQVVHVEKRRGGIRSGGWVR